ncbi:MAG: hypothetical protein LCH87_05720 [Actinobacteria bacterium]|nr:hypothetical protein [Actinomycetota bacterium]
MGPDSAQSRRWGAVTVVAVACHAVLQAWLVVAALSPGLLASVPEPLAWIARPGSVGAMSVVLGVGALAFGLVVATRWKASARVPFLLSAWSAGTAVPLAVAAYLPCTGDGPPLWDALSNAFALFLGSFEQPFGPGQACAYPTPLALQVARLLAILATLSGATSVLFSVSRSQLDRLAALRARRLVAVVGADVSSWPLVQHVARSAGRGVRTVLLTGEPEAHARAAPSDGVLVWRTPGDDPLALRDGFPWRRAVRCYLLAPDGGANRALARQLREALPPGVPGSPRLPVVARIDDPWHADDFRRGSIGDARVVFDAVGTHESTAGLLVERIRSVPEVTDLLLVGEGALALAVLAELSQAGREARYLDGAAVLPRVRLFGPGAADLLADHRVRQGRFASDPVAVDVASGEASLDDLEPALAGVGAAGGRAVVVVAQEGSRLGTRLSVRHPELSVFELAQGAGELGGAESAAGGLVEFALALAPSTGRGADAWERAARAVHERYRRRFPSAAHASPWEELPEFYRESNRRQLSSILDGMVALGRTWSPASPEDTPFDEARITSGEEEDRIAEGSRLFQLSEQEVAALAAAEHESWRAHHLAEGWRQGPRRDDDARRHPDLCGWEELTEASRRKTMAGVVDTLFRLRALGYRAVPAGPAVGWARYRRVGEVQASRLDRHHSWRSTDGAELAGVPGDWLVTDPSGGTRTVTDASFRATHEHDRGDTWRRTGVVEARPVLPGERVDTQEGPVVARGPGWVLRDGDGHAWVVGEEHFRAAYAPAGPAPAVSAGPATPPGGTGTRS